MASAETDSTPWRDEETLRHLYWDEEMTLMEVADELGVTRPTIYQWMEKHGIDRRMGRPETESEVSATTVTMTGDARDHAREVKNKLDLTWPEFLRRAADELDPDT